MAKKQRPLLAATGAAGALPAGKGHEKLFATIVTADAGKAFPEVAAFEELVYRPANHRPPETVPLLEPFRIKPLKLVKMARHHLEDRYQDLFPGRKAVGVAESVTGFDREHNAGEIPVECAWPAQQYLLVAPAAGKQVFIEKHHVEDGASSAAVCLMADQSQREGRIVDMMPVWERLGYSVFENKAKTGG
jgi:hypothetical protein